MDEIDKIQLMADLDHEHCELNHGPSVKGENFPASDYIILPFGYPENDLTDVAVRDMVIPVCRECATALVGNEWTLLYCFECCSSQWVCRRFAKNCYRHHILWLRGCPHCTNKFGGLFFSDMESLANSVMFLKDNGQRLTS